MDIKNSAQCLKIPQKVSFNITSEASYVYILGGQKFIKNAKNGQFWRKVKNASFLVIFNHCDSGASNSDLNMRLGHIS